MNTTMMEPLVKYSLDGRLSNISIMVIQSKAVSLLVKHCDSNILIKDW